MCTMGKLIFVCLFVLSSVGAQADTCALPAADSGEPYVTLAALTTSDLKLLLNEYMFQHDWTRHSEAASAGFREGNLVYGQVLKAGARFDPKATAAWRRAYTQSGRPQFL